MACFADINVSQGSVATYAGCGAIFDNHLTANLPRNLPVKFKKNRLRIDRILVTSLYVVPFLAVHPVVYVLALKVDGDAVRVGVVDAPAQQVESISPAAAGRSAQVRLGFLARYASVEVLDRLRRGGHRRRRRRP